jgi:uncharacterized protein YecA (UPF0149 family)
MSIDRGALARIDRKLLAGLETDEQWRVARLPVSEALWSAWKRYCSAIGISMGRGIAALIQRELEAVIGAEGDVDLLSETESRLRGRERQVENRERQLEERERAMLKRASLFTVVGRSVAPAEAPKLGRNEPCFCGSGLKYKRCHGLS